MGVVQEAFRERSEKVEGVQSTPSRSNHLAIGVATNCTIPGFINILTKLMVVGCVDTLTVPMEPLCTLAAGRANQSPADS